MQSRLATLGALHGRGVGVRARIVRSRPRQLGSVGFIATSVGDSNDDRNKAQIERRRFYRSIPLNSSAAAVQSSHFTDVEQEQLDEDMQRFAEACMSGLLPYDEYSDDRYKGPSSLDYELGESLIRDERDILYEDVEEEEVFLDSDQDVDESLQEPRQLRNLPQAPKRSAHEMLLSFSPNDDSNRPPDTNLEDLQLWIECESQREQVAKFQTVLDAARDRRDYSSLPLFQQQLLDWYEPLYKAIESLQRWYITEGASTKIDMQVYGPLLCSLQPQKLAVIAAHEGLLHGLLGGEDEGVTLASMALKIGEAVEVEKNVQQLIQIQLEQEASQRKQQGELEDEENELISSPTDQKFDGVLSPDTEDSKIDDLLNQWMYGASHLKRFLEGSTQDVKSRRKKITYTKLRAQKQRVENSLHSSGEWTKPQKLKLGAVLMDILLDKATFRSNSGMTEKAFRHEKMWVPFMKKKVGRVTLHKDFYQNLVENPDLTAPISTTAYTTRHKPMILPPRDWTSPSDGGYSWLNVDLMRTHKSKLQKEALYDADLTNLYDGLNALSQVPWRINEKILEVGKRCWHDNVPLGDIPSRDDYEVPPRPERPENNFEGFDEDSEGYKAAKAEYKAQYKAYLDALLKHKRFHQKNMDLRSLRGSATLKLQQAEKFKDFDQIYFPYNVDFRGRAYPVPPHLSNVGSDFCRGMLTFAEAKPLGKRGLYWIKVHLANLAGNDKLTFDGRAEYTEQNMDNIRACVADPFENRWWMTLDDPFQGLAACHEIVRAIDSGDPESYMSSLPVHMDGSCNGLQHYAALGRDPVGGRAVNICNDDTPQDVYIGVMHEVIRRVAIEASKDLATEHEDPENLTKEEKAELKRNRGAKLVNGLIDRGVVKRTVMTSVYGVTYVGARTQIQEKIEEKLEAKGHDIDEMEREIHSACGYLASLTMEVMGELFSGARQTMNWLTSCARLISQQGQPVAWVSPIGVPVIQPYRRSKPFRVVTLLQSVVLKDSADDLPIHKLRQVTAFPPNYVHSLDASHMFLTALEMDRRGLTFSAVHDSFWTHACDIDEMNEALRDCFVDLYERPLLETLKENWELRYPSITFPDIPERGNLDLKEVKSAKYFFQ